MLRWNGENGDEEDAVLVNSSFKPAFRDFISSSENSEILFARLILEKNQMLLKINVVGTINEIRATFMQYLLSKGVVKVFFENQNLKLHFHPILLRFFERNQPNFVACSCVPFQLLQSVN